MKIQCDVCQKREAMVFCAADEAALCECCDHKVHHANKLAGKHPRFPLLHPSFKDAPASSSSSSTGYHHQRSASSGSELSNYRLGGSENPSGLRGPDLFRQPSSNSMNSYHQQHYVSEEGSMSMSMSTTAATISSDQMPEMLMEFPSAANRGWRLEDFVESSAGTQRHSFYY